MTEESLQKLVNELNNYNVDEAESLIYLKPLNDVVDFAKVWMKIPTKNDSMSSGDGFYKVYFIKNDENIYVAAVLDMSRDLHWYVIPKHRKKGYLTKALKNAILPHLFLSRDEQRITITEDKIGSTNFQASEKVALRIGFTKDSSDEYYISNDDYIDYIPALDHNKSLSEERMNEIRNEINYVARTLWTLQNEIEMNFGESDFSENLEEMVHQIKSQTWKWEDFWWQNKNQ